MNFKPQASRAASARSWPAVASLIVLLCGCADFTRGEPSAKTPDAAGSGANTGTNGGTGGGSSVTPGSDGGVRADGSAADVATVAGPTFANTIHALLVNNCGGCHGAGLEAGNSAFLLNGDPEADGAVVRTLIDVSNPAASRLLSKASGVGHTGGTVIAAGTADYATLLAWIGAGAP